MPADARPVVHPAKILDQDLQAYDIASSAYWEFRVTGVGDAEDGAVAEDQGSVAYVGKDEPVLARRDARARGVQDHTRV
ncbi:hypothetical protein Psi02_72220 [Planotetraspora silvatica]|uniref:Uncharacterized protein n=1 Tax=Planotetraspora silvatica TaxID=234614 RepID=A0A8J3UT29_9ACTN|nr:hypothetical protein [Planotetraspora silvatica]GII50798.1 hypothetical protein Psi02_72220 [Planotetraspora silvatica]